MLPQSLLDALFILGLIVVRIILPIALTLALGFWLERKLQPREYAEQAARTQARWQARTSARSKRPAHCWEIKACDPALYKQCPAFLHADLPCWLALQVAGLKTIKCADCELYRPLAIAS